MHVWEGNPPLAAGAPYGSLDTFSLPAGQDCDRPLGSDDVSLAEGCSTTALSEQNKWHATAVVAVGVLIGAPFLNSGSFRGAWVQISHAFSSLRR